MSNLTANPTPKFLLTSQHEVDSLLEWINKRLEAKGFIFVGELKELVGLETTYIDDRWGWKELKVITVQKMNEGFLIDLPSAEQIQ